MNMKISIFGILLLVGAIIALAAIFLNWWSAYGVGITGWDFFAKDGGAGELTSLYIVPLILLILAIVAILIALMEFTGIGAEMNMIMKIVAIVVGILIIVLPIAMMMDIWSGTPISWTEFLAFGFWLEVAAGAIIAVAAVLSLLKVLPEPA